MQDLQFDELSRRFKEHGFSLYIIGGTSRDLLLGREFLDRDYCTDATPKDMRLFLSEANFVFANFGSVRYPSSFGEVDITTLREEGEYLDHRHPSKITFVKDTKLDYLRRDFTVNAIYLDEDYKIIDYCGGMDDLHNKVIRFIGEAKKRVEEDPLRILRAERFSKVLGFEIEPNSQRAMDEGRSLLKLLNPAKVEEERKKLERSI